MAVTCRTGSSNMKRPRREPKPSQGRPVSFNKFLLKFTAEEHEFTVFPDGRAIIKGTSEIDKALTLYSKYVGN
jgi:hypothetical protein